VFFGKLQLSVFIGSLSSSWLVRIISRGCTGFDRISGGFCRFSLDSYLGQILHARIWPRS